MLSYRSQIISRTSREAVKRSVELVVSPRTWGRAMACEVFDDVAFYWFLFSVMVMVIVPMSYSFLSTLQLRPPADWTRQLDSCKAAAPSPAPPPAAAAA